MLYAYRSAGNALLLALTTVSCAQIIGIETLEEESASASTGGTGGTGTGGTDCTQLNGCITFEDYRGEDPVTIDFTSGQYTPACIRVSPTATVKFVGDLSTHPLVSGDEPENPIPDQAIGSQATVIMNGLIGTFSYSCGSHPSEKGAICTQ